METLLPIDDSILLLLTVIAAVVLVVSLSSEPPRKKKEPPRPEADTPASRWRVFRILPKVLHDYESEKTEIVADEAGGARLVARPFPGQGWEFSLESKERKGAGQRAKEPAADDLNLEITRRGLLTPRFHVSLDGKPWLSVRADRGSRSLPEIRHHERGESLKITGSPHRREYEIRRGGKLVAMVSEAPPADGAREPNGDYTLEILRSEDPKPLLTLVLCMEAALPPRALTR